MKWVNSESTTLPIMSWCETLEDGAMTQAKNLANHPVVFRHVALMPDCHVGYGMPIGGVIACNNAVIPNAVGVDIGCGMAAVETDLPASELGDMSRIRTILEDIKRRIPVGEGNSHRTEQAWDEFDRYESTNGAALPAWAGNGGFTHDKKNLGTLGGGNHFIELQESDSGMLWIMLHSGSRNLGYRVAEQYNKLALSLNEKWKTALPDKHLPFLPADDEGQAYIRDMEFALQYAAENRARMMTVCRDVIASHFSQIRYISEINIHHNYANLEHHFGKNVWVHRKGATSAMSAQVGIIPGSMGSASYIVEGLGNPDSFMSCSHGAGRIMGRADACRNLRVEDCNEAMQGIVFDRWSTYHGRSKQDKKMLDLSEAPLAYKNIDSVIEAESDLVKPLVKLRPRGVIKG